MVGQGVKKVVSRQTGGKCIRIFILSHRLTGTPTDDRLVEVLAAHITQIVLKDRQQRTLHACRRWTISVP